MNKSQLMKFIRTPDKRHACDEAWQWLCDDVEGDADFADIWRACPDGHWMCWLTAHALGVESMERGFCHGWHRAARLFNPANDNFNDEYARAIRSFVDFIRVRNAIIVKLLDEG